MSIFKKQYYWHKCGDFLYKNPNTKRITPQDPEWQQYKRMPNGRRRLPIGYIDVTEYDLKCLTCRTTIDYEKQEAISQIQKKLQKNVLTDEEYEEHKQELNKIIIKNKEKKERIKTVIGILFFIIIIIYISITGKISIRF